MLMSWNKSLPVEMAPHSDTLSWFWANQSLLVFGLTRLGLKLMIYRTRGEYTNHNTTDAV
jgi:hypothetical protein